jgi:D-Tyr-tRNAtyr deacylase
MTKALPKWDAEREATLTSIVGGETPVTAKTVAAAAESLETSERSVASKLRNMKYEVESSAKSAGKAYSPEEEATITDFLNKYPNEFTYAEIAAKVLDGTRTPKQIQGKILSMELYDLVKQTEKVVRPKTYTEDEEVKLEALVLEGLFIEDIAEQMNREIPSIRGKILSMSRSNPAISIPKQKHTVSKKEDAFTALGDVGAMTVEEIAEAIDKTARGVRTLLTHRGIDCKNHNGVARHAKIQEAKEAQ